MKRDQNSASGVVHIISYEYTDSLGRETRMGYDLMNREIRRTEADGGVTRRFYDKNGQLIKVIRPSEYGQRGDEGAGVRYVYDAQGRIVTVLRPDGTLLENRAYDEAGNLTKSTDGAGNTTEYEYNGAGQMSALTDPEGEKERYAYVFMTRTDSSLKPSVHQSTNREVMREPGSAMSTTLRAGS